jgi:hypothetical protein
MSTPLQPIWLIDPIDPRTEPVLVVQEPRTERIPVRAPRRVDTSQDRDARRGATLPSRPRGSRNLLAVVLMLVLLLGGATAVISAFLDPATSQQSP